MDRENGSRWALAVNCISAQHIPANGDTSGQA